eukprot:567436-Rhodomonas_salina.2
MTEHMETVCESTHARVVSDARTRLAVRRRRTRDLVLRRTRGAGASEPRGERADPSRQDSWCRLLSVRNSCNLTRKHASTPHAFAPLMEHKARTAF